MKRNETENELSSKQSRALTALLSGARVEEAATAAGVSRTSVFRWLQDEVFAEALRTARAATLETVMQKMQATCLQAVEALTEILGNPTHPAGVRVAAARAILEGALKFRAEFDVERRLLALEQSARTQRRGMQ